MVTIFGPGHQDMALKCFSSICSLVLCCGKHDTFYFWNYYFDYCSLVLFCLFYQREEEESIEDLRAVSPTDKKSGFKLEKVGQVGDAMGNILFIITHFVC